MSVPEAGKWCDLARSASYDAAARGELPVLKFGRSLRVPTAKLRQMLGIDPQQEPDSSGEVIPMHRDA
jgi:hypothetical protein